MKPRILVIDDSEEIADLVTRILKKADFDVTTCNGGRQGLDTIAKDSFEVIITDLAMPEVNGFDIIKSVSRLRPYSRVIVITAHSDVENAIRALKDGANDFLSKPIDRAVLLESINRMLQERKSDLQHGLYKAAFAVFAHDEPARLPSVINQTACRVLQAGYCAVWVRQKHELVPIARVKRAKAKEPEQKVILRVVERALKSGEIVLDQITTLEAGARLMAHPIIQGGETLGVLLATRPPHEDGFARQEHELMTVLASQLSLALEGKELAALAARRTDNALLAWKSAEGFAAIASETLQAAQKLQALVDDESDDPIPTLATIRDGLDTLIETAQARKVRLEVPAGDIVQMALRLCDRAASTETVKGDPASVVCAPSPVAVAIAALVDTASAGKSHVKVGWDAIDNQVAMWVSCDRNWLPVDGVSRSVDTHLTRVLQFAADTANQHEGTFHLTNDPPRAELVLPGEGQPIIPSEVL